MANLAGGRSLNLYFPKATLANSSRRLVSIDLSAVERELFASKRFLEIPGKTWQLICKPTSSYGVFA
jgi:hypothetical protein